MKTFFTFLIILSSFQLLKSATFSSKATGVWNAPATWTLTSGSDSDGIPDVDDDVTIITSHTVTLNATQSYCKSLLINSSAFLAGGGKKIGIEGNFTVNGKVTGNMTLYMQKVGAVFSCATPYTVPGEWYIQKTCTIASGSVINKRSAINLQNSGTALHNFGTVILLNTSATQLDGRIVGLSSSVSWFNESGSSFTMNANPTGLLGINFKCTSVPNTVTYAGIGTQPLPAVYYNLSLTSAGTATLVGNLTVLNNFLITGSTISNIAVANKKIKVGGNLTTNGAFLLNSTDTLIFDGSSATAQTVAGTVQNTYPNITINNTGGSGVLFSTRTTVSDVLTMVRGNCNSSSSRLVLRSDINGTARLAAITNTANVSFSGNMVIEKFINDMPGQYYDLSSPTQGSQVMDWDNEIFISGVGAYDGIGGPAGVDGNSFNGAPTMHTYDEPSNTFGAVTSTNTILSPGTGYQLLLADDGSATNWFAKTMDTRGTPNYGDVALTGLTYNANQGGPDQPGGDGWHLVGNPYASHIDYAAVSKVRMTANIFYTNNGNYDDYVATFSTTVLPPFQGFYVQTNTSPLAHSITFTESCKVNNNTTEFYRKKSTRDIKLMVHSALVPYSHENTINFNQDATVNYDEDYDASYRKFPVPIAPAIYMVDETSNKKLIRNVIDSKSDEVTIPLGVFTPKAGVYYLDLTVANSDAYTELWIENTKTGNKYEVGSSVAVQGEELGTNTDFVLKMSKKSKTTSSLMANALENDVMVFTTENTLNLKSLNRDHMLQSVEIYDMTGKLVFSQLNVNATVTNVTKIDISFLNNGIYVVNTVDENGKVLNKKIVK